MRYSYYVFEVLFTNCNDYAYNFFISLFIKELNIICHIYLNHWY